MLALTAHTPPKHLPRTTSGAGAPGLTLVEMMVTLAMAAVLLQLAVPGLTGFQRNSELSSLANKLVAATNTARSEAMKTGRNTFVIPANGGSDWAAGWLVFIDSDADNRYDSAKDQTLVQHAAAPAYISITGTGNARANNTPQPYISFNGSGYARSIGNASTTNLTLSIQRSDVADAEAGEQTRRVMVARTGRVRACKPANDSSCTESGV